MKRRQRAESVPKAELQTSVPSRAWPEAITPQVATFPRFFTPNETDADPRHAKCTVLRDNWFARHNTGFKRFPFDNFTYCLTLFSKFFSSFPHGTCSLSVSRQYLALDGIYHPFWTAIPNYPTLWKHITQEQVPDQERDSHPPWCRVPTDFYLDCPRKCF